ncbi:SDR family oxidoreductase [Microbacterium sp. RD1]|uniref:SDR family oxidoreductase n=1 Tax=Microbacterium sp. RD1 TaxID=3457313 RepID=UPI003FA5674C
MRIVVIGGTGRIGARLVARLGAFDVLAAAPSTGVDATTGAGLDEALTGADVVIDVTRPHSYAPQEVHAFFETSTRHLLRAAAAAGVAHYVALTIVGTADARIPFYEAKATQERLIRDSGRPHTLVHATQFFEFFGGIADSATTSGVVRLPGALVQPIAADDVAQSLADVAASHPAGDIQIAGPERMALNEFVARGLAASGDPRLVVRDDEALYFGGSLAEHGLLPGPEARLSSTRFEDWLRTQG